MKRATKAPEPHLLVTNRAGRRAPLTAATLTALATQVLAGEGVTGPVEISLLYCGDDEIQELNRQFRHKNTPTDVLSFPCGERSGGVLVLGDIVISLATAERQSVPAERQSAPAERQSASGRYGLREEVRLLFCHGLLHLLGHDHRNKAEESAMIARQAQYLNVEIEAAWRHNPSH